MSPFKSLKQAAVAVVGSLLASIVAERLDNGEALKDVTAPVFIIHGMKDLQQQNYRTYYSVLEWRQN